MTQVDPIQQRLKDAGPYAVVPLWLLEAGVSDRAVRLFALLAAKYANKHGVCWPARESLAEALDCSLASLDRAIRELVKAGALRVEVRRPRTSLYVLMVEHPDHRTSGEVVTDEELGGGQFVTDDELTHHGRRVELVTDDEFNSSQVTSSMNHTHRTIPREPDPTNHGIPPSEESSLRSDSSVSPHGRQRPITADRVVELWNEICGDVLPRVLRLTRERKDKIRARLRAAPPGEVRDEQWWRALFERVRASQFLTGQVPPKPGREKSWHADFDWVIANETKIARILEGRYDDRRSRRVQDAKPKTGLDAELAALDHYLGDSPEAERIAERMAANGNRIAAIWLERRRAARSEHAGTG